MNRREFVKKSVAGLVVAPRVSAAAYGAGGVTTADPTSLIARSPLRPEDDARLKHAPSGKVLQGERYDAAFPDTLDLAERMRLAINALTNAFIPQERWALAFEVDFSRRPPELKANHATDAWLNIPAKFIEALVNCRLASGSNFNLEVDRKILATQLGLIGEDGLTYAPEGPLPELKGERNYSEVWGEGRLLLALAMLAQIDDDPRWVEIGRKKVDRLLSLSREKGDYRFLWKGRFTPGEEVPPDAAEPIKGVEGGSLADGDAVFSMMYSVGALGYGASLFYRVTKYPPALELSRGLAKWALARMFKNADGRYNFYHFHHGTFALMAVAEYAEAAQDAEVLRRVDACYRWARQMGDPLVGWYPEFMPGTDEFEEQDYESVEICEVSDMVFLALLLTRNGAGDYWDDVDRWVRNMYTEGQMTDADFLKRIPDRYLNPAPGEFSSQRWINIWNAVSKDTRDIGLRSVGSFFGWMRANDGLLVLKGDDGKEKLSPRSIMHCCTANGARVLYYVWDSIVSRSGERVRVNLLLNRASEWLDVQSYLPADGRVILKIKKAGEVAVRMPGWVTLGEVRTTVSGKKADTSVEGRYMAIGDLKPGDEVELTFPLPKQTLYRVLGRRPYRLTLAGSNVVAIDPPGVAYPLYRHQPTGKLVEKACFIPAKKVIW